MRCARRVGRGASPDAGNRAPPPLSQAKVFTLLTFAAIWALIHGIGDFVPAFLVPP